MWKRSAGFAAVGLLLVAASGTVAAADNQQTRNGAPPVTGTMYDGNNTQPPELTLQGPLAPITEALDSSAAFAPQQAGGGTSAGANAGGNSGAGRSGGGN